MLSVKSRRVLAMLWPIAGIALVGAGAWWVYKPAGLIAVGLLIILDTLHAARPRGTKQ